jgi:DNA polymerase-4
MRKILHIDMDAFYASIEQRDNPFLQGKPIAVGGNEKRGVTTTASYEARTFGVKSAMPAWQAKKLCPHLIFVPLRFEVYREVSQIIREIFFRYTDLVEPLSLDEAYLDVTINKKGISTATEVALRIKEDIFNETKLTASAGVSYCKFLAKIASDYRKPNGITVIRPHEALAFIDSLQIHQFFGVGKVTKEKMERLGIYTGKDLRQWSQIDLIKNFGKAGSIYYNMARGIDDRPIQSKQMRKSYAVERTVENNLLNMEEVLDLARKIIDNLWNGLEKHNLKARTVTLKTKNDNFVVKTRCFTSPLYIDQKQNLSDIYLNLIEQNHDICYNIRLLGLSVSNFEHEKQNSFNGQMDLFS